MLHTPEDFQSPDVDSVMVANPGQRSGEQDLGSKNTFTSCSKMVERRQPFKKSAVDPLSNDTYNTCT